MTGGPGDGPGDVRGPRSRDALEAMLHVLHEPGWLLDATGRIVAVGQAAERHLGVGPASMLGRRLSVLVDPADHERLPRRVLGGGEGSGAGTESRGGIGFMRSDGSRLTGELVIGELPGAGDARMVAVLRPDREAVDRELFSLVFRHAPDIITIVDRHGGQIVVNAAAERLLGHNLMRLEDNARMVHPDDLARVRANLPPRQDGYGGPVRYRARSAAGEWLWLESTSSDLLHVPPAGGMLVFTRDVTAEVVAVERLAAGRARMVALVTGLHAGILVEDEHRRVVIANDRLEAMFDPGDGVPVHEGADAGEVMRRLAALTADPAGCLAQTEAAAASRAPRLGEWPLASGGTVEIEGSPITGDAGEALGFLWAVRDVSDRVEREQHRRRMMELEQAAREAAERQNARLHELDRMRSQMIATVSHEFRTPLTPIASHVELLLDGTDPLTADQRESLEAVDRSVTRLRRLVDDLLTVRRVEQGLLDIHPAPVNVASLVATQTAQFTPYARRLEVELSCHVIPGLTAEADADRLGTVLDNLIANALKFTPAGGRVEVTARVEDGRWTIRVADTGRGVPAEDLPHVFEPFYRGAHVVHEGLPGSGLGLSVARALVEGHGGEIDAQSTPGRGSTFTVRLPLP